MRIVNSKLYDELIDLNSFEFVADTYFAGAINRVVNVDLKLEADIQEKLVNDCIDTPDLFLTMIFYGSTNSVEKLFGTTVFSKDPMGKNVLHYLAAVNEPRFLEMMATLPNDMWVEQDDIGKTPLHYLVNSHTDDAISKLKIPDAAWKIQDHYKYSPLHLWIAKRKCTIENLPKLQFTVQEFGSFIDTAMVTDVNSVMVFLELAKTKPEVQELLSSKLSQALVWGLEKVSIAILESNLVINLEYPTKIFNQTPIIIAAMIGNQVIIEKLIQLGCNVSAIDNFNMSAFDYAVYHGYNDIAAVLESSSHFSSVPCNYSITNFKFEPPKKRFIIESGFLLEVHLGSRDSRSKIPPVHFFKKSNHFAISIKSENAKCVRIDNDTHELTEYTPVLLLPFPSAISESFYIHTQSLKDTIIYFDFHSHTPAETVGTETAMASVILDAPVVSLWQERDSPLGGRMKVPIVGGQRTSIGTMTMEFVAMKAHPSKYVSDGISPAATAWTRNSVTLVGHRGLGMNRTVVKNGKPRLQMGENTIASLTKGGELGAHFVEFDVQLTRDLVPVLYHDFITSEWDNEVPVSMISSDRFKAKKGKVSRSNSFSSIDFSKLGDASMKPNGSGTIQFAFATLEEALKTVPLSCGFNIEIKYPHLEEAESNDLHNCEINTFCDRILDVIAKYGTDRDVLFSSFHPDICFLMCFKQVYFFH
jgi:glycerophosphoryl diester phosphodiesterase